MKRRKKSTRGKIILLTAALLAAVALFVSLILLKAETLTVSGNRYVTGALIEARVFPDPEKRSLLQVLIKEYITKPRIPGIRSMQIEPQDLKVWNIAVTEEEAACQVYDGSFYDILTENGVVLARLKDQDPDLMLLQGIRVKEAAVLEELVTEPEESLADGLAYLARFREFGIGIDEITSDKDGCTVRIGGVAILLGTGSEAEAKVREIRDQLPLYRDLKGTLHMEHFSPDNAAVRIYFEVDPDMVPPETEEASGEEEAE